MTQGHGSHNADTANGARWTWWPALATAVIWGVNVPVMKAGLGELDPYVFNASRLTLSAITLGLVDRWEHRASGKLERVAIPWRTVLWFGLLSSFVYQLMFLVGMDATTASDAALIVASGPLWTTLLSRLYGIERYSPQTMVSLAVAFIGTMLVTASAADDSGSGSLFGNLTILAAMLTWAWATVLSRPILQWFPATRLAFLSTLVSLPGHWAIAVPKLGAGTIDRPGFVTATVVYSGVLSTGFAYAWWNRSVRTLGPARTASFAYLVPVVALAVAWWFLSERPATIQLVGGALVIAGLASRGKQR